jgi:hypothetical protein
VGIAHCILSDSKEFGPTNERRTDLGRPGI